MSKEIKIEVPVGYEVDTEKSTFQKIVFKEVKKEIMDRIKTFENVLEYLGESDEKVIEYRKLIKANITSKILANQMAVCFVRALNEKYIFNWNNLNERKYRIWWNMENSTLRFDGSSWFVSSSSVAASLCFKNEKLANYAGNNKEYVEICRKFML